MFFLYFCPRKREKGTILYFLIFIVMTEKTRKVVTPQEAVSSKMYLTAKEAASFIGTTLNYFYKLTSQHKLPMYNPTGRKLLFKKSELVAWVERARIGSDEELQAKAELELIRKGGHR